MEKERTHISYVSPEMEIILFESSDIVTASGPSGEQDPNWDEDSW